MKTKYYEGIYDLKIHFKPLLQSGKGGDLGTNYDDVGMDISEV